MSRRLYQPLPTHYTTYKHHQQIPQPIPPTISNESPIKAYRKIGRKLGRKLYRKSCSVGNGIIYMVRRDTPSSIVGCLLPSSVMMLVVPTTN